VAGLVKVPGGMLVFRGIATTHVAARQAQAQMHPGVAELDAFPAHMLFRFGDFHLIQVLTIRRHVFLLD
jgi:hypothetical protein